MAQQSEGAAGGGVRMLLRVEGLALFAAAVAAYIWHGGPWWLFVVLFFAPDLSFLAFLGGPRRGALVYNAVHTTLGPIGLFAIGIAGGWTWAPSVALIWAAHVGFDRAAGYGLKYATSFQATHLGRIGRMPA